jgi:hypothetical protein
VRSALWIGGVRFGRLGLYDCIDALWAYKRAWGVRNRSARAYGWTLVCRGRTVIGSSDKVHVVDALAITGEEGRGSLRKAAGSWQTSIDPQISEWGNPARKGHSLLNT